MPYLKKIVRSLIGVRIRRDIVVVLGIRKRFFATGQHLMRIRLVGYIVNDVVMRGIKYRVQCNGSLYHAKVRTKVTTMLGRTAQKRCADFINKTLAACCIKFFNIFRIIDLLEIHARPFCMLGC